MIFGVKVGEHHRSVTNPLLLRLVLGALFRVFPTVAPQRVAIDNLITVAESEEELWRKLSEWKERVEAKGLRLNIGKTKILISDANLDTLQE